MDYKKAVYIAIGIDMNRRKDVLGMYVGENEGAKVWLSIMNCLKDRGVRDILIACVDDRVPLGNWGSLPENGNPTMYYPPDTEYDEVRIL